MTSVEHVAAPGKASGLIAPGAPPKKVLCAHLRDDFSGAARVFSQSIAELKLAGHDVRVLVGSGGASGFIRARHAVEPVPYPLAGNRWTLLFSFLRAQLSLFLRVAKICRHWTPDLVYVNTLMPAGAIAAGAISGRRVITHAHEVGMSSALIFRVLRNCALRFSSRIICVSAYTARSLGVPPARARVVYNTLGFEDWQQADEIARTKTYPGQEAFTVMMAGSLKWYKGIDSFLALARSMADRTDAAIRFDLVVNCEPAELDEFLRITPIPASVAITHRPRSVFDHYAGAHLVLNLSHPDGWIETFGMTLLEGMACAIPAVAPTVGGCLEVADAGRGIWFIDSRDVASLQELVLRLAADPAAWQLASRAARQSSENFRLERFRAALLHAVDL